MVDGRSVRYLLEAEERVQDRRALASAARSATGAFIAGLYPWEFFVTLTYDPRKVQGRGGPVVEETILGAPVAPFVTAWKFRRDVERWLKDVQNALRRPVAAVAVGEPHKSGVYHGHVVLGLGGALDGDVRVMSRLWFTRHGYIDIEPVRSRADVSQYCGDYMSKDVSELVMSRSLVSQVAMLRRQGGRRR